MTSVSASASLSGNTPSAAPLPVSLTGMPHTLNLISSTAEELLSLEHIRAVLQRLEDTIVFQLIERAQFAHNAKMYKPGAFPELKDKEGWEASWTEWFLKETEGAHAKLRRWEAPDEYPFTAAKLLPEPILPPVEYPALLWPSNHNHDINANARIYKFYVSKIVPSICSKTPAANETSVGAVPSGTPEDGTDDGQYGSAAVRDVEVLSALSRRIHFGMFVSESKFRSEPASFVPHILAAVDPHAEGAAQNETREEARDKLLALITKPAVEAALLKRLAEKARVYGGDFDAAFVAQSKGESSDEVNKELERRRKIKVDTVVGIYKDFVIPTTKVVEVEYLEQRLKGLTKEQIKELREGKSWEEVAGKKA